MDHAEVRRIPLFDGLDDEQLRALVDGGTEVFFSPGEVLFHEGRPADHWWVLVDGSIDLVRHIGREETLLAAMDVPGKWAGGFRAWDDTGVYLATGRASTAGRILRIPAGSLRACTSRWFPFGDHLVDGLFRTARRIESVVREKEALIALGTLSAGLAHELNNPAAAVTRAVDALGHQSEALLSSLRRLAERSITAEQFHALDELRREIPPQPAIPDPLEVADLEEALAACLSRHGAERAWALASALARSGVGVEWCERVAAVLGDALEPGVEWVASALGEARSLSEVRDAAGRISGLVAAVSSYTQMDRATMQLADVTEGLDSTLVMLSHRIPAGVTVVRDYGSGVPRLEVAAAELNQVWTNLIGNALDAMGDDGTLRVRTRPDRDGVLVEIGDSGPGMPLEVRQRAFDPFFTTKGVGQGTGLGLDISRRIVERHGGEIAIDSSPGDTVLRVRLRPAAARRG